MLKDEAFGGFKTFSGEDKDFIDKVTESYMDCIPCCLDLENDLEVNIFMDKLFSIAVKKLARRFN